ncbi:hypothetical protein [Chromohalobacter sp. 296-RDG]|uniref:hypothetical protein n=1 Tax=Chromohalobacter sp. 296-RDG TaxID=2994062 RepID=UPI002469C0ED|nr:hypothetical protein [Chromohalobacter sp. 296-RDG]
MPQGKTSHLVVHVGDRKTGSTSIQEALATKRVSVEGKTLCYPSRMAHNYLRHELASTSDLSKTSFQSLMENIYKEGADFTILSSELLELVDPKRMKVVKERYFDQVSDSVQFLAYLRPHAARIVSSCAEQFKIGTHQGGLEDFFLKTMKNREYYYYSRVSRWKEILGETYVLRPMIRSELKNSNVVDDFLHTAFQGHPFSIAAGASANESLGLRDLMLLKLIHRFTQDHPPQKRLQIGWTIAQLINEDEDEDKNEPQDKLRIHRSLAERVAKTYRKDAKKVDAMMFDGRSLLQAELDKAVDTAPVAAQSLEPEDYFSPNERRAIVSLAKTIGRLMGMNGVAPHLFQSRVQAMHDSIYDI